MNGSMNYTSALAWVQGMNDANYLGHHDWQLPTSPKRDHSCREKGPYNNFGFDCKKNALSYLYYEELGFTATETAVPIPPNTVGPFSNFQPNFYWSNSTAGNVPDFSFANGVQSGSTQADFLDVLPMIHDEISGAPTPTGTGLVPNLIGQTVFDPETKTTWLANANLAATWLEDGNGGAIDTLGLPLCVTPSSPAPCVALDGSMNYESAMAFINAMNQYEDPITHVVVGYLGHQDWELPKVDATCPNYGCAKDANPMGNLYYNQLNDQRGFPAGTPVVPVPDIAVGPFHHLLPFPYWSCLAKTIQDACEIAYPAPGFEWGFSFGDGFLGTAPVTANHFVTAYFVGCDLSTCQTITFAPITGTEDALSSLALSATASSGLAVTFSSTTPNVCTVSGNTASLLFPGKCTIEASQAGDESFESALPVQQTFTVNHAVQTITFPPIPAQKVGAEVHLGATASSGLKVTYSASSPQVISPCVIAGDIADMLAPGLCIIGAYQAGDDLYAPAHLDRSFTVKAQ
jgi:hypothetical protein